MNRVVILLVLLAGIAVIANSRSTDAPRTGLEVAPEPRPVEAARIAAHLATVERELLERDVSHLTPAQRAARQENLRRLRKYRLRGVFPHNHDFLGQRVPYFIDRHGTLCAMAYLIQQSGREDIVQRVAATQNNARVRQLAGDPELVAWLEANGLSAEEAGRIQPKYSCDGQSQHPWCQSEPQPQASQHDLSGPAFAIGSSAAVLGAGAIAWNTLPGSSDGTSTGRVVFGLGSGILGLALGVPRLNDGGESRAMGIVDAGIGLMSLAVSALKLVAPTRSGAAETVAAESRSLSVAPLVARGSNGEAKVGLSVRF